MSNILVPSEIEERYRMPRGRAVRLARAGKLPAIHLPDGQIRFDEAVIEEFLKSTMTPPRATDADTVRTRERCA